MILNFTHGEEDITGYFGQNLTSELLEHIRGRMKEFQEETGDLYSLEATPAEGTTYRFAKEDKKYFPDIIQAGMGENIYYTNSSQIPVDYTDDPFEALMLQDELQTKYTGGTVLHLYMREKISSPDAVFDFTISAAADSVSKQPDFIALTALPDKNRDRL